MQFIANGQESCLQARQRLGHGQETRDRSSKGKIMANRQSHIKQYGNIDKIQERNLSKEERGHWTDI